MRLYAWDEWWIGDLCSTNLMITMAFPLQGEEMLRGKQMKGAM